MLFTFLDHQWKAFWRSKNKGKSIAAQILIGFVVVYMLILAIVVGAGLGELIRHVFPGKDQIVVFNGFILYYFAIDFLMRMQLQELPTLSIVPYLHLKIPKSKLVNFLNIRALFTGFNFLPLILFTPFCLTAIARAHGPGTALMYILSVFSLMVFNNYLALYLKRLSIVNLKVIPALLVVITTLGLLEYFKVFSIAAGSNLVFSFIARHPFAGIGFILLAVMMYIVNARYLRRNLYVEELSAREEKKGSTDYPLLDRFGEVGTLAALEVKLVLRHKRTRSALTMSLIMMLYGFLFYKQEVIEKNSFGMMLFAAIFMSGSAMSMYGQFMFGWQSNHFDGLLVHKTNLRNFLKAKFLLFTIMSTVTMLITCLYGLISWKILAVQFAAYLYNVGIGSVIVLYFATRNYKSIDLTRTAAFNFQGVGASQWVMSLPYFLLPYVVYGPFTAMGMPFWGLAVLGILGLTCLLTREFWVNFLLNELNKRKYQIAEGFRERS